MPPQVLLLLKGHPGVGKSEIAERIAREMHWALADKDFARDAGASNELSYDIMLRFAERQLSVGLSCVLDSPFAQLLALRSQAATLPPLPSSSLGRGALMPALANFQSQVSYSRSMAGSATR